MYNKNKKDMENLHSLQIDQSLNFILGGNATLTAKSKLTGKHFTYQITTPKKDSDIWFVKLLTGVNNEGDFSYIGFIKNNNFIFGVKSKISKEATGVKAFESILKFVTAKVNNKHLELFHSGICSRCGRTITNPKSLHTGVGPECSKKMVA